MKKVEHKRFLLFVLIFIIFCGVFFIPRYLGHLQYDALEDELLAIGNNSMYPISKLVFAPDFTHPPLWYILMDYPTSILGLNHGIFYYRLIQVSSLFCLIIFTLFYFYKKLSDKFLFTFFTLFLSNIYLVHLTTQHRMYAMVIGISVFYSFYWYHLIKNSNDKSFKHFIFLGFIAAFGFLVNYSIVWLISVWPLAYLFYKRGFYSFKRLAAFFLTFVLLTAWFIPIFIRNANKSIALNQWAPDFNFINIMQMVNNYFGFIPMKDELSRTNPLAIIFLFLILALIFLKKTKRNQQISHIAILISTLMIFLVFLIAAYLTKNSLLYPRTAITLVVVFYILISDCLNNIKYFKVIFILLILLQASQFLLYFNQEKNFSKNYFFTDYNKNTVNYFNRYNFLENSCIVVAPSWNITAAKFFLSKKVKVILPSELNSEKVGKGTPYCSQIYLLVQISVEKKVIEEQIDIVLQGNYTFELVHSFENQKLYILEEESK